MFKTDAKLLCLGNRDCIHISVKHLHVSAPWPAYSYTCPQNQIPVSGQQEPTADTVGRKDSSGPESLATFLTDFTLLVTDKG